jgi:hypothetical protein
MKENHAEDFLLVQNALISEESELVAFWVIGNPASGGLFIFSVGNLPTVHEFGPIINMAPLVNPEFAVITGLCDGSRIDEEHATDQVEDAHAG